MKIIDELNRLRDERSKAVMDRDFDKALKIEEEWVNLVMQYEAR